MARGFHALAEMPLAAREARPYPDHMDPFTLFDEWYSEARSSEPADPDAMALATASPDGRPSVRMVLFKDHGPDGWVFYTNRESHKGSDLAANPHAALCIHWKSLYRQVRIEGRVEQVPDAMSDAYFESRGRAKQIAAIASDQSQPMPSRGVFEERMERLAREYPDGILPRPDHWGGYRVIPDRIEFWQGTRDRIHHRQLFRPDGDGGWTKTLLYP